MELQNALCPQKAFTTFFLQLRYNTLHQILPGVLIDMFSSVCFLIDVHFLFICLQCAISNSLEKLILEKFVLPSNA